MVIDRGVVAFIDGKVALKGTRTLVGVDLKEQRTVSCSFGVDINVRILGVDGGGGLMGACSATASGGHNEELDAGSGKERC